MSLKFVDETLQGCVCLGQFSILALLVCEQKISGCCRRRVTIVIYHCLIIGGRFRSGQGFRGCRRPPFLIKLPSREAGNNQQRENKNRRNFLAIAQPEHLSFQCSITRLNGRGRHERRGALCHASLSRARVRPYFNSSRKCNASGTVEITPSRNNERPAARRARFFSALLSSSPTPIPRITRVTATSAISGTAMSTLLESSLITSSLKLRSTLASRIQDSCKFKNRSNPAAVALPILFMWRAMTKHQLCGIRRKIRRIGPPGMNQ